MHSHCQVSEKPGYYSNDKLIMGRLNLHVPTLTLLWGVWSAFPIMTVAPFRLDEWKKICFSHSKLTCMTGWSTKDTQQGKLVTWLYQSTKEHQWWLKLATKNRNPVSKRIEYEKGGCVSPPMFVPILMSNCKQSIECLVWGDWTTICGIVCNKHLEHISKTKCLDSWQALCWYVLWLFPLYYDL